MSLAQEQETDRRHLIWVYSDNLAVTMDAATWLETTRELGRLGWDVTLITAGPPELESVRGVPVKAIYSPDKYLVRQVAFHRQVLQEIRRQYHSADVVLFHQMTAPWMFLLRAARPFLGSPHPILVMDTRTAPMVPKEVATRRDRMHALFVDTMNSFANRLADGQTAITARMAKMMGIPDKQLLGVWPSGVTRETFAAAARVRQWPVNQDPIRLVYVGRLHYQRNLMRMCQAVVEANARGMNFAFEIVGDGTERKDLERYAASTNGRISVLSPVPHEAIPDVLARAHIGVLPFPDRDSFRVSSPIKLFEYLASGMPILATRIECHTDVVGSDKYAFWASDPSVEALLEALQNAWQNRRSLPALGQLAQEASASWTWASAASKLDRALRKGIAAPRGGETTPPVRTAASQ